MPSSDGNQTRASIAGATQKDNYIVAHFPAEREEKYEI